MTPGAAAFIIIAPTLFAVCIALQVYLSKKASKWAGLVLPAITFCGSIAAIMWITLYSVTTSQRLNVSGGFVYVTQTYYPMLSYNAEAIVETNIYTFLFYNIPTVIFMSIYVAYKGRRGARSALEKMSAQDLE
jgi:hypothetical protein